jgi:hypothetical protein
MKKIINKNKYPGIYPPPEVDKDFDPRIRIKSADFIFMNTGINEALIFLVTKIRYKKEYSCTF